MKTHKVSLSFDMVVRDEHHTRVLEKSVQVEFEHTPGTQSEKDLIASAAVHLRDTALRSLSDLDLKELNEFEAQRAVGPLNALRVDAQASDQTLPEDIAF